MEILVSFILGLLILLAMGYATYISSVLVSEKKRRER
tara:strand:+ start:331 stop:441 length:111 start_codon:yes stop_codon:yes gene_type:complete